MEKRCAYATVRLPEWVKQEVEKIAKDEDRSLSNTLMRLIIEALASRDSEVA